MEPKPENPGIPTDEAYVSAVSLARAREKNIGLPSNSVESDDALPLDGLASVIADPHMHETIRARARGLVNGPTTYPSDEVRPKDLGRPDRPARRGSG